jgi:O-antigen ligase
MTNMVSRSNLLDLSRDGAPDVVTERPPFRGVLAWRPDAVSLLSALTFCTFVFPARFVVKGFGAVGTPANVIGIGMLVLWLFARMRGSMPGLRRQPVRIVVAIYLFIIILTYGTGFSRGMFPDEASNATRFVIGTAAVSGIALFTADAMPNRARMHVLLQRIVFGAAFMGFVGDLEFLTKFDLVSYMQFPGLVINDHLIGFSERGSGGFLRVAGTASHYIEFGVVLAMLVPLAIHMAVFAPTRGKRQFNWLLVVTIAVGVPFAISRAAALSMVVAMLVIMSCWTWRARFNALVLAAIGAVGMKAAKPGLLGTIKSLFLNAGSDPSISGRTTDYGPSFALIRSRPLVGRGAGTFIPTRYRFLDNQILMTTIESGVLGLLALLALFFGGIAMAHRVGKMSLDPETKHLGYALLAIFMTGFVASFTFDSLSFPIFTTVLFLSLGLAGALWRLDEPARRARYLVDQISEDGANEALAEADR